MKKTEQLLVAEMDEVKLIRWQLLSWSFLINYH